MAFLLVAAIWSPAKAKPYIDDTVADQWFTGSLEAPSPAFPKAGLFAIEPYTIYSTNTGAYNGFWGHYAVPNDRNQVSSVTVLKYGITDHLSIEALPSLSHAWNGLTNTNGLGLGDLPIEFQYRLNEKNRATGLPSLTIFMGMSFPIGAYDRLSNPLDGFGSGAFIAKQGFVLESLFDTWGDHPMRVRFFGSAYEAVASAPVSGTSVYGTNQGFQGAATPGFSTALGVGVEYGLNQRWVLALDLVHNYAEGARLNGMNANGGLINATGASSMVIALAPAIEYNISGSLGIIVGVAFSVAGYNTSSYIAPQIAISKTF
jgi:hypothetical protein